MEKIRIHEKPDIVRKVLEIPNNPVIEIAQEIQKIIAPNEIGLTNGICMPRIIDTLSSETSREFDKINSRMTVARMAEEIAETHTDFQTRIHDILS